MAPSGNQPLVLTTGELHSTPDVLQKEIGSRYSGQAWNLLDLLHATELEQRRATSLLRRKYAVLIGFASQFSAAGITLALGRSFAERKGASALRI
jgi:hypothetical protein